MNLTLTPTNGFTQEQVKSWSLLYLKWLQQGFANSLSILNCSNVDPHDPLHDPQKTKLGFRTDPCIRTYLRGMCGNLGLARDPVPHSHLCDGSIREFGNYRFFFTDSKIASSLDDRICQRLTDTKNFESAPCSIISIGSNNLWSFEEAAYDNTACQIHTYEPRREDNHGGGAIRIPDRIASRTTLHWGFMGLVSKSETPHSPPVYSWTDILKRTQRMEKPLILKLDCEGCEFNFFPYLMKIGSLHLLPNQIVLEVHIRPNMFKKSSDSTYHKILEIYRLLFSAGYAIFTNHIGDGGCEVGFIRIQESIV